MENPTLERKRRVLFVMDRWSSSAGGIQTVNRELASAVGEQFPDLGCIVLVTQATQAEREEAYSRGVTLISGSTPEWTAALLSSQLVSIPATDVIAVIGHSYFSGAQAKLLRDRFFKHAASVHFIHMSPLDTESLKEYRRDEYVIIRETRVKQELEIAQNADLVCCIGPRLWRYMNDMLISRGFSGIILRMNCGLNSDRSERAVTPVHPTLLCLGRTDSIGVKGLDIFALAAGHLTKLWNGHPLTRQRPSPRFVVRGAKDDAEALESKLTQMARSIEPKAQILVRPYTSEREELEADFRGASIFVMPSREEGYGLVACEALSLGIPAIVTSESGIAEVITEVANQGYIRTDQCIVDSKGSIDEVGTRYANAALSILSDEQGALAYFHQLRERMLISCSWRVGAATLMDAILKLHKGAETAEVAVLQSRAPPNSNLINIRRERADDLFETARKKLLSQSGVIGASVRHVLLAVVEKGKGKDVPAQVDGIDVIVREVEGISFSAAPVVEPGDALVINGVQAGCVGPILRNERGNIYAATAAHVVSGHRRGANLQIRTRTGLLSVGQFDLHESFDLALLTIPIGSGSNRKVERASDPEIGMPVTIYLPDSNLSGRVSGIDMDLNALRADQSPQNMEAMIEIEVDGPLRPGSSGALVCDDSGIAAFGIVVAAAALSDLRGERNTNVVYAKPLRPSLHKLSLAVVTNKPVLSYEPSRSCVLFLATSQEIFQKILKRFNKPKEMLASDVRYYVEEPTSGNVIRYAAVLPGIGNIASAIFATKIARELRFDYLILIGLAGGLARARQQIGDVVISSEIVYYEPAKIVGDQVSPRFRISGMTPRWLSNIAQEIAASVDEKENKRPTRVLVGAIASGEKVLSASPRVEGMFGGWDSIIAIEMEAAGVAEALSASVSTDIPFIVVHGISDLVRSTEKLDMSMRDSAGDEAIGIAFQLSSRLGAGR